MSLIEIQTVVEYPDSLSRIFRNSFRQSGSNIVPKLLSRMSCECVLWTSIQCENFVGFLQAPQVSVRLTWTLAYFIKPSAAGPISSTNSHLVFATGQLHNGALTTTYHQRFGQMPAIAWRWRLRLLCQNHKAKVGALYHVKFKILHITFKWSILCRYIMWNSWCISKCHSFFAERCIYICRIPDGMAQTKQHISVQFFWWLGHPTMSRQHGPSNSSLSSSTEDLRTRKRRMKSMRNSTTWWWNWRLTISTEW